MLKHLFKLTWNKKKQNFLIVLEVFISFIVLFAVFSLLIYQQRNHNKPMGFNYENVWVVNIFPEDRARNWGLSDSVNNYHESIKQEAHSFPEVQEASFCNFNTPFAMGQANAPVKYNNKEIISNFYITDDHYANALGMKLLEGRWFDKRDNGMAETPIVINKMVSENLFGAEDPIGKVVTSGMDSVKKLRVVGIVDDFKDKGDFIAPENGIFMRMTEGEEAGSGTLLLKMKPGSGGNVESRLQKILSGAAKNATVRIDHLAELRKIKNKTVLIPTIILLVVCAFLIINVGLGLFGVLWHNINKRKSEIGLRRAVGATQNGVSFQLIGEALAMATLAMIAGSFFAVQFPLLHVFDMPAGIYIAAIVAAIGFIYILVLICALYPGKQAAKLYPAMVLHED
jgi:putative ABC transport system permease protein